MDLLSQVVVFVFFFLLSYDFSGAMVSSHNNSDCERMGQREQPTKCSIIRGNSKNGRRKRKTSDGKTIMKLYTLRNEMS